MSEYLIDVPQPVLDDLAERLARTRLPEHARPDDWALGTGPDALGRLLEHWRETYDWRAAEKRLNTWDHQLTRAGGLDLHHVRAGTRGRPPLLLIHGWPDSFLRFETLLPLLADDFDLVVPSIPGYGFSAAPTGRGWHAGRVADAFAELMDDLGHERFAVHGGDLGSGIAEQLALRHPDRVTALHLTDVPYGHLFGVDPLDEQEQEQEYLKRGMQWFQAEGAYAHLQSTRPQTLAYALEDSPAGLAAWFLEKFRAWSDCHGDVWTRFSPDTLVTNLMIYWVTRTAGSAARYYAEDVPWDGPSGPVTAPTAVAIFPADIVPAPRTFAERWFDLRRFTEMPRGGHFAAWEEPELLADDLRTFLAQYSS